VARAAPHSTILVRAGTYRESVVVRVPDLVIRGEDRFRTILDGGDEDLTGISVEGFGEVTIRDLTIRNYRGSGIALDGVTGYAIERVDLIKDRTVGIDAIGSYEGVVQDVFVWGSGDSGIRIAGCFACSTVVRSAQSRWSYLGLSIVNATGVVVSESRFVHNGVGVAAIAAADRPFAPGSGVSIVGNVVRNNDYGSVPAAGISEISGIPFGTGIWIAGTANAAVSSNVVQGNDRYGILVSRSLDRLVDPVNATVSTNQIDGAGGLDLAWDGTGRDNCFEANSFEGATGPPEVEARYPCGARPFEGTVYAPVFDDVEQALIVDPDRPQEESPEPNRPRCQRGRAGCG
jgi:parallel beta-helix repeat protein